MINKYSTGVFVNFLMPSYFFSERAIIMLFRIVYTDFVATARKLSELWKSATDLNSKCQNVKYDGIGHLFELNGLFSCC